MRNKLLLNYLCLSALSIIHQYPSCSIAEAADSIASSTIEKGHVVDANPSRDNQMLIRDDDDRMDARRGSIETPLRRKREIGGTISGLEQRRGSPINPSSRGERFAKRSEGRTGLRSSRKLSADNKNDEGNNRMANSMAKIAAADAPSDNQGNEDERAKEMKRSPHSSSALATLKSKPSKAEEEELDDDSEEYSDETGEGDEDDPESAVNIAAEGDKDRYGNPSESENAAEYEELEVKEMGKREAEDRNDEDYDDCADDEGDEESGPDEGREVALSERREDRNEGRFKRNYDEAADNESNEDPVDESEPHQGEPEVANSETEEPNESVESSGVKKEAKLDGSSGEVEATPDAAEKETSQDKSGENSMYEKKVEEEIQRKIDSIKEDIKRAVVEREKIRDIEINNAKFDELQSEAENDEESDEAADPSDPENEPSKRSSMKTDKRRTKRVSESKDLALQLRAVEGVEKLDPDILRKAKLRHESIKKRSAPVFGAVDAPESPQTDGNVGFDHPRQVYLSNNEADDGGSSSSSFNMEKTKRTLKKTEINNPMIIPEQAKAEIEDDIPADFSFDSSLISGDGKNNGISKRNTESFNFVRRRRASAVIPEGRIAFLGYRPDQDDEDDDEGGEFEDDGFQDRTSNLREEKSYYNEEDENRANYFLFPGLNRQSNKIEDRYARRRRAGSRGGGTTIGRRRARGRAEQLKNAKRGSRKKNLMDRDKRQAKIDTRPDNTASLIGSTRELSPRLATEYREAFGGLQSEPGGALARFKRVKRAVTRDS